MCSKFCPKNVKEETYLENLGVDERTARSRILLQKPTVPQLVKIFPICYVTIRFTTVFTTARHLYLS